MNFKPLIPYIAAALVVVFFAGWFWGRSNLKQEIRDAPIVQRDTLLLIKTDTLTIVRVKEVKGKPQEVPQYLIDSLVALKDKNATIKRLARPFLVDTTLHSANKDSTVFVDSWLSFTADCINKRITNLTYAPKVRTELQYITNTKVIFEKEAWWEAAIGYAGVGLCTYGIVKKDAGLSAWGAALVTVRIML